MKKASLFYISVFVMILLVLVPMKTQAATKYNGINVYIVGDSIIAGTGNMPTYKPATKVEGESGMRYAGFGHYLNRANLNFRKSSEYNTAVLLKKNSVTVKFDQSRGGSLLCGKVNGMIYKQVISMKKQLSKDIKQASS